MNQPLPPVEQAKVFFFFLLLTVLSLILGAGIPLVLVTAGGLYRMRSTQDFSYMETVLIIHKGFAGIVAVGMVLIALSDKHLEPIVLTLLIYPVYSFLLNFLFYAPLCRHKEWVVANGIFSTTSTETKYAMSAPWISFGKYASIADELLKLNNLKDANLITLEEFSTLRSKLLR
jgi:hypothetical protein